MLGGRTMVGDADLRLGDCITLLKDVPDNSVDMVFTAPPYGHNNNNDDLIANRENALGKSKSGEARPISQDSPEEATQLFRALLPQIKRVLVPGGGICCCCCGGGGPDPQFARWSLWLDEILHFKQMVVWDKRSMGMGWHYRRSYETVLVASKGQPCKWYDDSNRIENIIRHISKIIPRADQHPTEKPVELAEFFIRLHTRPGDLVLDPLMGSGSTGEAALRLGRHFLGMEIDPRWFAMAEKRLSVIQRKML